MMSSGLSDLDSQYLAYLRALQELHVKKRLLQECISNGFLAMSKARFVMGVQRVSSLQYNSVMKANTTVCLQHDEDDNVSFQVCVGRNGVEKSDANKEKTLRKRTDKEDEGITVPTSAQLQGESTSGLNLSEIPFDDEVEPLASDPIKWFGVLVPLALRQSQSDFEKALIIAGEICSLQSKLKFLQRMIQEQKME